MSRPEPSVLERLTRARTNLILDQPFFGVLAYRLKLVEDPSCRDMWTDGKSVGYNPAYVQGLVDVELKGLLAQMVVHVASGHPWRKAWREQKLWVKACHYATNPLLKESGLRLPPNALFNEEFKGMTAELIYEELVKQLPPPPPPKQKPKANPSAPSGADSKEQPDGVPGEGGQGDEQGGEQSAQDGASPPEDESSGQEGDGEGQPDENSGNDEQHAPGEVRPAPSDVKEEEWKLHVKAAAMQAGSLPGNLQRLVKGFTPPKVDWKEFLWSFVQTAYQQSDFSWSRPNPRWVHQGLYMPSLQSERMRCLVVARDTSASVSDKYLKAFNAELEAIIEMYNPEHVWVVDCDVKIQAEVEIDDGLMPEALETAHGGGGTKFGPVYRWVQERDIDPSCLIYFTDLEGSCDAPEPDYPVLWACPEATMMGRKPPFGEVLSIDLQ